MKKNIHIAPQNYTACKKQLNNSRIQEKRSKQEVLTLFEIIPKVFLRRSLKYFRYIETYLER
jgi:hypothetical protein